MTSLLFAEPKIITDYRPRPSHPRGPSWWCAFRDGDKDEPHLVGWGASEGTAIDALMEIEDRNEAERQLEGAGYVP